MSINDVTELTAAEMREMDGGKRKEYNILPVEPILPFPPVITLPVEPIVLDPISI